MEKLPPSRMNMIATIAASIGMMGAIGSTAQVLQKKRGKAPTGMKWRHPGVYIPGGANRNVEPTRIRNPKIAEQVNAMYEKWFSAKQAREAAKAGV